MQLDRHETMRTIRFMNSSIQLNSGRATSIVTAGILDKPLVNRMFHLSLFHMKFDLTPGFFPPLALGPLAFVKQIVFFVCKSK